MSNANQETIEDIVADIRAQNQGLPEDSYALSPLVCDLLSFADRIESAAKREREAGAEAAQVCGEIGEMIGREATREKSSRVGNTEKMREALVKAKKAICHHAKYVCQSLSWENSDIQSNCGDILCAHRDLCEAKTAINAALASPPRNCDRPECATTKAAQNVWNKEDGGKTAYYEWLLAESTKGEAE